MASFLFGSDPEQNIISCYKVNDKTIRVYKKINNIVSYEDREFYPFFFISDISLIEELTPQPLKKKLQGNNYYKYLCVFQNWNDLKNAYNFAFETYKKKKDISEKEFNEISFKNDPIGQYLIEYGKTLFKGFSFSDLYRINIELITKNNPKDKNQEISAIILTDNKGWKRIIQDSRKNDAQKIQEFIKIIIDKDPDIIAGYNLYSSTLDFLIKKCEELEINLNIGRNDLPIEKQERFFKYDYDFEKNKIVIPGRHFVDIIDLVLQYDVIKKLQDVGSLNNIINLFNIKIDDRISNDESEKVFNNCIIINEICEKLLPSIFYLNRLISYNLGRVLKLTHAQKIDSILYREYLKQRYTLPIPDKTDPSIGQINEIYYTGVLGPIVVCEVIKLYQNAILKSEFKSEKDPLGLFKKALQDIMNIIKPEEIAESTPENESDKENYEPEFKKALESFSHSFFPYLNTPWVIYNSKEFGENVFQIAKELMDKITKYISYTGGIPVQVDNNEIVFVPPRDITSEELEKSYVSMLSKKMVEVEGIEYKFRARRVLSYKKKNMAFLLYNNKILMKTNILFPHNLENFARKFLLQCIDYILNNKIQEIHNLFVSYYNDIRDRKLDITDFMRTEIIKESLSDYNFRVKKEKRNIIPHYQLALSTGKTYKINDKISFYVISDEAVHKRLNIDKEIIQKMQNLSEEILDTKINPKDIYQGCENLKLASEWNPNFRDESIEYYQNRLFEIADKLKVFFTPEDFSNVFSVDELFTYPLDKVKIRTSRAE